MYRVAHVKIRNNTRYRAGSPVKKKYLCIHTTNNYNEGADAENHRLFLETTTSSVSFALVVDDSETIELMPLDEPSYSAGDGPNGEHNTYDIAMEICCDKLDKEGKLDKNVYTNAINTAAKIIVHENVEMIQHRDVPERTWKNCPHAWILDYQKFKKDVEKQVQILKGPPSYLKSDLDILVSNGIITTPAYWLINAKAGEKVRGDYAASLIHNMATYLKEVKTDG